jgi:hypothetical protein
MSWGTPAVLESLELLARRAHRSEPEPLPPRRFPGRISDCPGEEITPLLRHLLGIIPRRKARGLGPEHLNAGPGGRVRLSRNSRRS